MNNAFGGFTKTDRVVGFVESYIIDAEYPLESEDDLEYELDEGERFQYLEFPGYFFSKN